MPDLRPRVATAQVLTLLNQHFRTPILDLAPVEGGEVARVFSFRVEEQEYIVRFNLDKMLTSNFPKEAYLVRKLAGTSLPLAPLLHVGRLGELYFAISRKMPGKMLHEYTPQEVQALLPQILDLLEMAHSVDTHQTQGYGVFDDQGRGLDASWHARLLKIADEEDERDYFGKWHQLFSERLLLEARDVRTPGDDRKRTQPRHYILSYLREQSQTQIESNKNEASERAIKG